MKENPIRYFWRKENNGPFKYCLYKSQYFEEKNHIITESTYINKTGEDKFKTEVSFACSENYIKSIISKKFKILKIYSDFKKNIFSKSSDKIVFVLQKL